jgi:succinyl-diaminopimelate desuccinylase
LNGDQNGPCVHFNGHLDVVPVGEGWTRDPFGGEIVGDRLYGRGTTDMKAGLAASLYAIEAIRRAGIRLPGAVEQSATVDEESGGFAGVAYLAEHGHLNPERQQHVIITEPHGPDRICLGHRGVWWFDVVVHGHIAHGSMPFNGINAVDRMTELISAVNSRLRPRLAGRVTAMPVAPGGARCPTLNINSIFAGQPIERRQTPCVPDRCTVIFDRRFLPEEDLNEVKREFADLLAETGVPHEIRERMTVMPSFTPQDSPVSVAVAGAIREVCGKPAEYMASPGTYDQKHFVRIAKINDCISYGPGVLDMAHQPDEYVSLKDMETSATVMALATLRLMGLT